MKKSSTTDHRLTTAATLGSLLAAFSASGAVRTGPDTVSLFLPEEPGIYKGAAGDA